MDRLKITLPLAFSLCAGGVQALELHSSIGTTIEHTDNGLRSQGNERSELESDLWLTFGAAHVGPNLDLGADYRVTRTWYKHDTQEDETTAEGNADLRWQILEQSLFLDVSHSRRNILQDSDQVDLLGNREDRDVTTVSPSYVLRLGGADTVTFAATWTDVNYEDRGERDSQRYGVSVGWSRQLSAVDNLLVNVSTTEVENESDFVGDYRYDSATVGYSAQLSRLRYTVLVGANRTARDRDGDDVDGALVDIEASYESGFNLWTLLARHGLSDSSLGNGNQGLDDFQSFDSSRNEVDILEQTRVQLDWTNTALCQRCTLNVGAFAEEEDYEEQPDDNREWGVELGFGYQLTRTADAGIIYRYRDLQFTDDNPRDDYDVNEVRLVFDQRLGQRLRAGVFVGWEERSSNAGTSDYDVFSGGLTLAYEWL